MFLKADKSTLVKLQVIGDYIAFGYPTKKMVNDLVRKRGFLKKDGKKLPITDNVLIEELLCGDQFGAYGSICIEDIIDTVFKCHDDNLSSVLSESQKVMWPF